MSAHSVDFAASTVFFISCSTAVAFLTDLLFGGSETNDVVVLSLSTSCIKRRLHARFHLVSSTNHASHLGSDNLNLRCEIASPVYRMKLVTASRNILPGTINFGNMGRQILCMSIGGRQGRAPGPGEDEGWPELGILATVSN